MTNVLFARYTWAPDAKEPVVTDVETLPVQSLAIILYANVGGHGSDGRGWRKL